jgi:hypothetical protein
MDNIMITTNQLILMLLITLLKKQTQLLQYVPFRYL